MKSISMNLEQGQSVIEAFQAKLDELEIDANAEELTVGEYRELIINRLQN